MATPAGRRDHLRRLFACTLLVRAVTADGNPVDFLAPLVDSAWELGEPARDAAVRFLAWCRLNLPCDWRDDPSAPALLTLAVLLLSAETATAAALAAVLVEELDAVLIDPELPWRRRPRSPLYIRRDTDSASTRRLWSALVTRCLGDNPAVVDPRLAALGRALDGNAATPITELRALFTGTTKRECCIRQHQTVLASTLPAGRFTPRNGHTIGVHRSVRGSAEMRALDHAVFSELTQETVARSRHTSS